MAKRDFNAAEEAKTKALLAETSRRNATRAAALAKIRAGMKKLRMDSDKQIAKEKELALAAAKSRSIMGRMGAVAGAIGKITMAIFPLVVAFTALKRVIGAVIRTMVDFVKAADRKEKSLIVLTSLYGGNRKVAEDLRKELVKYAEATSFSVQGTMDLATQLRALGFNAEETISSIKNFGRLSFGDPAKLKLIAKAYSDVRAQNRLMATEVRQFANQGVPILQELQQQMGLSALELKKAIKDGLVSFEDVDKAIKSIAERFGDVDKAGLKTYSGQMDAAAEASENLKAELAQLTDLDDFFLTMAAGLNVVIGSLMRAVEALKSYKEGLKAVLRISDTFLTTLKSSSVKMRVFVELLERWAKTTSPGSITSEHLTQAAEAKRQGHAARQEEEQRLAKLEEMEELRKKRHLEYRAKVAKLNGDDSKAKQLERELRLEEAKARAIADGQNAAGIHLYRERERNLMIMEEELATQEKIAEQYEKMADLEKKRGERESNLMEKALGVAGPGEMRQNSVEEWTYLKTQKDNAERERRDQRRFDDQQRNERANAEFIVRGLKEEGSTTKSDIIGI